MLGEPLCLPPAQTHAAKVGTMLQGVPGWVSSAQLTAQAPLPWVEGFSSHLPSGAGPVAMPVLTGDLRQGLALAAWSEHSRWHHPPGHGSSGRMRGAHKTGVSPLGAGTWPRGCREAREGRASL